MAAYIIIETAYARYKCHAYRIKAGRVYFNSRAINLANVINIIGKNDETLYENKDIEKIIKPRAKPVIQRAKASKTTRLAQERKPSKKSSLPDVIQL